MDLEEFLPQMNVDYAENAMSSITAPQVSNKKTHKQHESSRKHIVGDDKSVQQQYQANSPQTKNVLMKSSAIKYSNKPELLNQSVSKTYAAYKENALSPITDYKGIGSEKKENKSETVTKTAPADKSMQKGLQAYTQQTKKPASALPAFYKKPFKYGWKRELIWGTNWKTSKEKADVYYITPSGKKLRTRGEILPYLKGDLDIEHFSFAREPLGVGTKYERIRFDLPDFYKKPFKYGWKRELIWRTNWKTSKEKADVYYITPCGKKLKTRSEILPFLKGHLDTEHFSFAREPLGVGTEFERVRFAKPSSMATVTAPTAPAAPSLIKLEKPFLKRKYPGSASPPPSKLTAKRAMEDKGAVRISSNSSQTDGTRTHDATPSNKSIRQARSGAIKKHAISANERTLPDVGSLASSSIECKYQIPQLKCVKCHECVGLNPSNSGYRTIDGQNGREYICDVCLSLKESSPETPLCVPKLSLATPPIYGGNSISIVAVKGRKVNIENDLSQIEDDVGKINNIINQQMNIENYITQIKENVQKQKNILNQQRYIGKYFGQIEDKKQNTLNQQVNIENDLTQIEDNVGKKKHIINQQMNIENYIAQIVDNVQKKKNILNQQRYSEIYFREIEDKQNTLNQLVKIENDYTQIEDNVGKEQNTLNQQVKIENDHTQMEDNVGKEQNTLNQLVKIENDLPQIEDNVGKNKHIINQQMDIENYITQIEDNVQKKKNILNQQRYSEIYFREIEDKQNTLNQLVKIENDYTQIEDNVGKEQNTLNQQVKIENDHTQMEDNVGKEQNTLNQQVKCENDLPQIEDNVGKEQNTLNQQVKIENDHTQLEDNVGKEQNTLNQLVKIENDLPQIEDNVGKNKHIINQQMDIENYITQIEDNVQKKKNILNQQRYIGKYFGQIEDKKQNTLNQQVNIENDLTQIEDNVRKKKHIINQQMNIENYITQIEDNVQKNLQSQ